MKRSLEAIRGLSFVGLFVGAATFYFGLVSAFSCSIATGFYSPYSPSCPTTFPTIAIDISPSVAIIVLSVLGFVFSGRIASD